MTNPPISSPVSFVVHVARLPKKGMPVRIEADATQLAKLAREHGVPSVGEFSFDLLVEPWKRNGVRVSGFVEATIVQECVVTLEPLTSTIHEPVEAVFLPEDSKLGRQGFEEGGEIVLDAAGPDSPELFSGDTIDVGALAEQFFGLAIDPYPRKDSVALPASEPANEENVADWQQKLRAFSQKP